jgi:hypothetical protein
LNDKPSPRRRFQFRLRTLMIAVTLLAVPCAYVGRQVKIVRERRTWLEDLRTGYWTGSQYDKSKSPSVLRRWLGDRAVERVYLRDISPAQLEEIKWLFPEAKVSCDSLHPT